MSRPLSLLCAAALLAACGEDGAGPAPDLSVEGPGPFPVGTRTRTYTDEGRGRTMTVQVWYPATADAAAATAAGFPIEELEEEPRRSRYAALLAAADPACPTRRAHAARDATPAPGGHPVVGFSHCHECTRWSSLTVVERLASHGIIVVAVDHEGNTLWDQLDGTGLPLDTTTLELRVGDLGFAIDRFLRGGDFREIAATVDARRLGVLGHSFGAVTAGMYAQAQQLGGAFALAAPMENPLLPGVSVAGLDESLGFLLAREDNSISELGNTLLRNNFAAARGPAWKIEVADAGHWSVSDLVGVVDAFAPGCGAGTRQTDGGAFTYLDAATGRSIAPAYVTAFFEATLLDEPGARAYLGAARPGALVSVESR